MKTEVEDAKKGALLHGDWTPYHTLIQKVVDTCVPFSAVLELTYRCNFRCVQCYVVQDKQENRLTTAEVKGLLDQLVKAGTLYLILTGGEPFLRDDLFEILDEARQRRFAVTIQTNGFQLTRSNVDRLAQYGNLMGLAVSFYGGSKETFEAVTRVPGSYERVLAGLKYAVSRKIRVRMKTPVISTNLCTLDKMKDLARDLKIAYRYTPIISPKDDGSKETLVHRLTDDEMRTFLRGEKKENLSHRPKAPDTPLCTAARAQVTISPSGEVYPCVQLRHSGGNIRQKPFAEIWKSDVFEAYRKISLAHLKNCSGCKLLSYCVPCIGFAEIEHGSYRKAPAEYCRLAHLKREIDLEKK